jgi:hypothetical protein
MQFIDERRAAPRIAIFQPIEFRIRDLRLRGHLLEISAVGALIYVRTRAAKGDRIRLHGDFDLGGARVVWSDGTRLGAEFDQPLSDQQVTLLLAHRERMADAFAHRIDAAMAEAVRA